ncbi:MAG: hypothetical protein QOD35_3413 [Nocardioidaceae bacterium]|nr:hypothetical protein [Nocardioidaceae bacterium]
MVRCDLCGASPSGTDAEARPDADASPSASDAEGDRGASPTGANALADAVDADPTVPLSWAVSIEAGRTRTYCEACAREHLRSIEAKLDSEWW